MHLSRMFANDGGIDFSQDFLRLGNLSLSLFFCRGGEEGETEAALVKEEGNGIDESPHSGAQTKAWICFIYLWKSMAVLFTRCRK